MNPMFNPSVYKTRREELKKRMKSGIAIFLGNHESPMNYPSNTYKYRQDSNFIYFFGITVPNLAAIVDFDENKEILFGDDFEIDDIIWMGDQPTIRSLAEKASITQVMPLSKLADYLGNAKDRKIHFTPPYRAENKIMLANMTGINVNEIRNFASVELIKAIIELRSIKEDIEIVELERAGEYSFLMHTTAMHACKSGIKELEISGLIEGIALSKGNGVSFPVILSQHGETLHNHNHGDILEKEKMLLIDAGCESEMNYCSDHTRTLPIGGKFTLKQQEIYEIVLKANMTGITACRPGIYYRDVHFLAAEVIATGLKELGLMKGDIKEAVQLGAHALFFPHGLGHQLGLDVHDMEDLGENYVGYDDTIQRSTIFGTNALRLAKELKPGFCLTVEPGIYFIPKLIEIWESEKKFEQFINYSKVMDYIDFGGIRIEDNVLITNQNHKTIGPHIPKTVDELEAVIGK